MRAQLRQDGYEAAVRERLRRATPLVSLAELSRAPGRDRDPDRRDRTASTARVGSSSSSSSDAAANRSAGAPLPPIALWYTEAPRAVAAAGGAAGLFSSLAELLGLWHEMRRGSHNGAHDTDTVIDTGMHAGTSMHAICMACVLNVYYTCRRARALVLWSAATIGQHARRTQRAAVALCSPRAAGRGDLHRRPLPPCCRTARSCACSKKKGRLCSARRAIGGT